MKIKAKVGYNVIIGDLGITLNSEKRDWTIISDDDYEKSLDIKKLSKFLIIQKSKASNEIEKSQPLVTSEDTDTNKVFVSEGRYYKNPDDVFVRMETEEKIDDTIINNEEKVINELETAEESIEKNEIVEEQTPVIAEVIEEKSTVEINLPVENKGEKSQKAEKSKNKSKTKTK